MSHVHSAWLFGVPSVRCVQPARCVRLFHGLFAGFCAAWHVRIQCSAQGFAGEHSGKRIMCPVFA
eukprot:10880137-Alexandrium_andersonii.AAC.1